MNFAADSNRRARTWKRFVLATVVALQSLTSPAADIPERPGAAAAARWLKQAGDEAGLVNEKLVQPGLWIEMASVYAQLGDFGNSDGYFAAVEALDRDAGGANPRTQYARMFAAMPKARALAQAGNMKEALAAAEANIPPTDRWRVVGHAAIGQAEAGDVPGALTTASKIAAGAKERVLGKMARVLAEGGKLAEARTVADANPANYWKDQSLAHVAAGQARAGKLDEALATAALIKTESSLLPAFGGIAIARAEQGDFAGASRALELATKPFVKAAIIRQVGECTLKIEDVRAVATAAEQVGAGGQWGWLKPVVVTQLRLKDLAGAQRSAQMLEEKARDWSQHTNVVMALLPAGKLDTVDAFIQTAKSPMARPILERRVIIALLAQNETRPAAMERLAKISPLSGVIHDPISAHTAELEREIMLLLATWGDVKSARSIHERLPAMLKNEFLDWELADALKKGGEPTDWEKLVVENQKKLDAAAPEQRKQLQAMMLVMRVRAGDWEEVRKHSTRFDEREWIQLLFPFMHVKSGVNAKLLIELVKRVPLPPQMAGAVLAAVARDLVSAGRQAEIDELIAKLPTAGQRASALIGAAKGILTVEPERQEF